MNDDPHLMIATRRVANQVSKICRPDLSWLFVAGLAAIAAIALLPSIASANTPPPGPCEDSYVAPTPTSIPVTTLPITVSSTTADYFVLYIRSARPPYQTKGRPIQVKLGEEGTTTLSDNLAPVNVNRYLLEKYSVAQPGDLDGDCVDDVTELKDLGSYSPINSGKKIDLVNGAVFIESREAFQTLSFNGDTGIRGLEYLNGLEFIKFSIRDLSGNTPPAYFINSNTHKIHSDFDEAIGAPASRVNEVGNGTIVYYPNVAAKDGSLGVYAFRFDRWGIAGFSSVKSYHQIIAANMPFLKDNLYYQPTTNSQIQVYESEKSQYDNSRVNVLLDKDISPDVDYIPFNQAEGYGRLRLMQDGERPSPYDIAIYQTLPNDLPRVGGTITTVPQTPLSHVNLRAIQNGLPNAYIRDALTNDTITSLIGSYVYFAVTADGYTIREATKADVDKHFAALRPQSTQTLQQDLTVTDITPLSSVNFADWTAFGVKAANVAELTKLSLPAGTTPVGYAVPFYFYDEFMKQATVEEETILGKKKAPADEKITLPIGTTLSSAVTQMLEHSKFQSDADIQEEMLDDLRKAIKGATSPAWIITALTAMHGNYPDGQSLRYRSSTNNEDLPSFNGAGLYSSKTQDPDETEDDGIDKSIKAVWASLWNYRAFLERDFHRVDHTTVAMGVLVHPNYSDEKVNGVAVSYDPITFQNNQHYINSQVGEDLVTNPESSSEPEQLLLNANGDATVLARSNLAKSNNLLMSTAQMKQLRSNLDTIHNRFRSLYQVADGDDFAIEIEFKITSGNKLAIKQARPWIFPEPLVLPDPEVTLALSASQAAEDGTLDLTVTRSGGIMSSPLTVTLSWNETKAMLSSTKPASVKIPGNHTSVTVAVPLDNDEEDEHDSVVTVKISARDTYDIGTSGSASATITDDDDPPSEPVISIAPDGDVTEGTDATYTLTATPKPTANLDVIVEVTQSGDFVTTGSQTVTITSSGTAALTVPTDDDSNNEADGSVTATIIDGTGYIVSSSAGSTTVAVSDDDASTEVKSQATIDKCVSDSLLNTVRRYYDANKDREPFYGRNWKRVLVAFADVQDSQLTPYTAVEARASEQKWSGWKPIREALECIEEAPDPPPVDPVISITAGNHVTEGSDATFTVTSTPSPSADLDVTVEVSQSGDYVSTGARTITISTSGSATFTVSTTNDTTDEADGSVTATLGAGTGYTVSSSAGAATVNVSDDDVPEISIAAGSGVTEGTPASFTLTASPTPAADLDVTISVSQSGDYVTTGTRIVTISNSGSKTFTVATTNDSDDEPDGSVTATISSGTGYTVSSSAGVALVAVSDDDVSTKVKSQEIIDKCVSDSLLNTVRRYYDANKDRAPNYGRNWKRVLVAFADVQDSQITPYTAAEARAGEQKWFGWKPIREALECIEDASDPPPPVDPVITIAAGSDVTEGSDATFTITASPNPTSALTVNLTVSQSGSFGASTVADTVTIPTTGSATYTVSTTNDNIDEPDGSVTSTLNTGAGYTVSVTNNAATVSVSDDDDPPVIAPIVSIAAGSDVSEGNDATFTITAAPNPTSALTVNLTVSQSGSFGASTGTQTVTIPTSGSYTLTVPTTNDSTDEADGSVTATLNTGTGYTVSVTNNAATVSDDDDPPVITPIVSIAAGSDVAEGNDASFTITASPNPTSALTVNLTVSENGDYGASTGTQTVTIPTSGSYTLTVNTTNDSTDEADGSVTATLNTGSGYTLSTSNVAATVAVSDDDDPPPLADVTISIAGASGVEGREVYFEVTLSRAADHEVRVWWRTGFDFDGNTPALDGIEFWTMDGWVVFAPGETSQWEEVYLNNDPYPEPDETFIVELSDPDGASIAKGEATMVIIDDD